MARRELELKNFFEEASIALLVLSREGKILRANRAFLDLVNGPAKRVVGQSLRRFFSDPTVLQDLLRMLVNRQTLRSFATQLRSASGQLKSVVLDANVLWEEGQFVYSRWFVRDITQRKRLEQELIELSEREQRRFAQELHDGLGQQLGGIAYLSNVLREQLAERGAPEARDAERIFGLVRNAIEQTRRVARGLSPIHPEAEGLMDALRELTAQTRELFGIRCRFGCPRPVLLDDPVVAGHLFRIAQEAANNALKHAKPRVVHIGLERTRDRVKLSVSDDGRGIGSVTPDRKGLGLRIMQYRASLIRGTLAVRRRRFCGTAVSCSVPVGGAAHP